MEVTNILSNDILDSCVCMMYIKAFFVLVAYEEIFNCFAQEVGRLAISVHLASTLMPE